MPARPPTLAYPWRRQAGPAEPPRPTPSVGPPRLPNVGSAAATVALLPPLSPPGRDRKASATPRGCPGRVRRVRTTSAALSLDRRPRHALRPAPTAGGSGLFP